MPRGKNLLRCINPSPHCSRSRSVIQIKGETIRDPHKEVSWVKWRQQCWESPGIYRVAIIALHTASLDFSSSTNNLWFGWLTNLGHPLKHTHNTCSFAHGKVFTTNQQTVRQWKYAIQVSSGWKDPSRLLGFVHVSPAQMRRVHT